MKKLICLFVMVMLLGGCFHHTPKKSKPSAPFQSPSFNNFKSKGKEDAELFQTIGLGYFKQKDLARAQFFLTKAVKLDPKLYWSWCCLGLLNIDNKEGYSYLKKSVKVKPDFPIPYYWMAYYHCRVREDQKAIPLFRKYVELADGKPGEEDRLMAAKEALQELQSGKEGKALALIREPSEKVTAQK